MGIKERISIHFTELTKTDRKIISQLLIEPDILLDHSIQQAAKELTVSPAAIMRMVKKLEYRGLAEFKLGLEAMKRLEHQEEQQQEDSLVDQVLINYQQMLTTVRNVLDEQQLKSIAQDIENYSYVKVLGLGSSGLSAEQLVYSLLYQDEYVESVTSRTKMFYLSRSLHSDTLLIVFSVSGNPMIYQELFEQAKVAKAKIILVTMNHDEKLKELVDEIVWMPSNYTRFSSKNGLQQLDNRFSFYVFSEVVALYFDQLN